MEDKELANPYSDFNNLFSTEGMCEPKITEKQFIENRNKLELADDALVDDEEVKLVLTPTLNDLWENNVYKYTRNGNKLIIPLWHHELVYDIEDEEFTVQMKPRLPSANFWLDENNNLHQFCEFTVAALWDDVVSEIGHSIHFGKKKFVFYPCQLLLKTHQKWVWEKQGISCIQHESIFDISRRADVILHIHITNLA